MVVREEYLVVIRPLAISSDGPPDRERMIGLGISLVDWGSGKNNNYPKIILTGERREGVCFVHSSKTGKNTRSLGATQLDTRPTGGLSVRGFARRTEENQPAHSVAQ